MSSSSQQRKVLLVGCFAWVAAFAIAGSTIETPNSDSMRGATPLTLPYCENVCFQAGSFEKINYEYEAPCSWNMWNQFSTVTWYCERFNCGASGHYYIPMAGTADYPCHANSQYLTCPDDTCSNVRR